MGYQTRDDEADIVVRRSTATDDVIRRRAVLVTRGTRNHNDVRVGSSVRGAIDLVEVASRLAGIRRSTIDDPMIGLDAALVALSGRIRLHEGGDVLAEDVIRDLWDQVLASERPEEPDGDQGKAVAP
jgi:MoxR-like ATPase